MRTQIYPCLLFSAFLSMTGFGQGPELGWIRTTGSNGDDYGSSISVTTDGNIVSYGHFYGIVDFDPDPDSTVLLIEYSDAAYITKHDPQGELVWAKLLRGPGGYHYHGVIAAAPDGGFCVMGSFNGTVDLDPSTDSLMTTSSGGQDGFIAKYNTDGELEWARTVAGSGDATCIGLDVGPQGSIGLVGAFNGSVDLEPEGNAEPLYNSNNGSTDLFAIALSATGEFQWGFCTGSLNDDFGDGVAIDASGAMYICAGYSGVMDMDPAFGSAYPMSSAGFHDVVLAKYSNTGEFGWAGRLGGDGDDWGNHLELDGNGHLYITGDFSGTFDLDPGLGSQFEIQSTGQWDGYVVKCDTAGGFVWARATGGSESEIGSEIVLDDDGNVYYSGGFGGSADFDPSNDTYTLTSAGMGDGFVSKLDHDGDLVWAFRIGGLQDDWCNSLALSSTGELYVTGYYRDTSDFAVAGEDPEFVSNGFADMFLMQLDNVFTGVDKRDETLPSSWFPNPTIGPVTLVPGRYIADAEIILRDASGRMLDRLHAGSPSSRFAIDLSPYENGMYLIEVRGVDGTKAVERIVKQ